MHNGVYGAFDGASSKNICHRSFGFINGCHGNCQLNVKAEGLPGMMRKDNNKGRDVYPERKPWFCVSLLRTRGVSTIFRFSFRKKRKIVTPYQIVVI